MLYRLSDLRKDFGDRRILDIDELHLEKGKIFSLRGANGAGKSTLLSILSFLDKPTDGSLQFLGQDVLYKKHSLQAFRKKVVLVEQSPLLFSGNVTRNVEFGLKIRKVPKHERRKRVAEVLDHVGMTAFAKADAQRLSGGETKRIALARALAVNPEVLLLDEPAANVDLKNQDIIFDIIKRINQQFGTSVIFSTHHAPGEIDLEHHALTLINGKVMKKMERNTFTGRVKICDQKVVICELLGSSIQLKMPVEGGVTVGDRFTIHIDPKLVEFVKPGEDIPESNAFSAEILTLTRERKKVFYSLNFGLDLFVESTFNQYKNYPIRLGQAVIVKIPQHALTVKRDRSRLPG